MPSQMPSQMLQHAGRKAPGVAVYLLSPAQEHPVPFAAGAGLYGCRGEGGGGGGGGGEGDGAGGVQQWGRLFHRR
eukprot:1143251-Pelagomonas_calceolata.AAC.2